MEYKSPYFDLAGRFWAEDEGAPLSPWATRLYFRLLYEANRRFWRGPLHLSWSYLLGVLGLGSRNTLYRAISDLKARGLIEYWRDGKKSAFWFPGMPIDGSVQKMNQPETIGSKNEPVIGSKNEPMYYIGSKNEPQTGPISEPISEPIGEPIDGSVQKMNQSNAASEAVKKPVGSKNEPALNTIRHKDNKTNTKKERDIYNNFSTPSGVFKPERRRTKPESNPNVLSKNAETDFPVLEENVLPSECKGIPCGKILELYAFYFNQPYKRLNKKEAALIRERVVENPAFDWEGFFKYVAQHKSKDYTLYQLFMARIFYQLKEEWEKEKRLEEKLDKLAEEVKAEHRFGQPMPLAAVLRGMIGDDSG